MKFQGNSLVIGGYGVIGRKVVASLVAQADKETITVIDDNQTFMFNPRDVLSHNVTVSPNNAEQIRQMFIGHDVVYCLTTDRRCYDVQSNYSLNTLAPIIAMQAAKESRVPRFVLVSTQEVYGDAPCPQGGYHSGCPTLPLSHYAAANAAMECAALSMRRDGLDVTCLRVAEVFGPEVKHDFPYLMQYIASGILDTMSGEKRSFNLVDPHLIARGFVHVDEVVKCVIEAGAIKESQALYDVCGGTPHSLFEIAARLADLYDTELKYVPTDRPQDVAKVLFANPSLAVSDLRLDVGRDFSADLRETALWLKANHAKTETADSVS